MRFLRTLDVGDVFRPAHPEQVSLNRRKMDRGHTFRITKVFPMEPKVTISVRTRAPKDGFYSLGPGTPVILPKEPNPSIEEIYAFLGVRRPRRAISYRLLWDGISPLEEILAPQAQAAMRLMASCGKTEYTTNELVKLFDQHFEKFYGKRCKSAGSGVFLFYRRRLVALGLLQELVAAGPVPTSVREANLQETMR